MRNYFSKKFFLQLAGLFSVVVILLGISFYQSSVEGDRLEVDFFDVGQGDSVLIKTPNHKKILIDGGPSNIVVQKLGENLPFYDKKIDLIILTHPHADHLDGLIEVLKRYEVEKILSTGVVHTTPDYLSWLQEIKNQKILVEIATAGQILDFGGGVKMEILYPKEDLTGKSVENLNNTSVVAKLIFNNTSFLFTGDAENETEEELIRDGVYLKANVLKIGHHGSKDSTSQEFLEEVSPDIAVISVGAKNNFSHPSRLILKRLERLGIMVYRTDRDGDIKFFSDGMKIELGE